MIRYANEQLVNRAGRWLKVAAVVFIAVCLLIDFLPRHGPPDFRYTGSDPAIAVWNLGWPPALFIFDPKHGFQVGPFAYLMLPLQLVVFAVGLIVVAAFRRLHNPPMQRTGRGALSYNRAPVSSGRPFIGIPLSL